MIMQQAKIETGQQWLYLTWAIMFSIEQNKIKKIHFIEQSKKKKEKKTENVYEK